MPRIAEHKKRKGMGPNSIGDRLNQNQPKNHMLLVIGDDMRFNHLHHH